MLALFANCLMLAARLPASDTAARRAEDEAWMAERRAGRADARTR